MMPAAANAQAVDDEDAHCSFQFRDLAYVILADAKEHGLGRWEEVREVASAFGGKTIRDADHEAGAERGRLVRRAVLAQGSVKRKLELEPGEFRRTVVFDVDVLDREVAVWIVVVYSCLCKGGDLKQCEDRERCQKVTFHSNPPQEVERSSKVNAVTAISAVTANDTIYWSFSQPYSTSLEAMSSTALMRIIRNLR